jgi:thioester reductase-like protein
MNVLLTGVTGKLGGSIFKKINGDVDHIVLLVRSGSDRDAYERVLRAFPQIRSENIVVISSDLTKPNLAINKKTYAELTNNITHIVHCAASTRFNLSYADAYRNNFITTNNIIKFALRCKKLVNFFHISTAYIAGKQTGVIYETENACKNREFINTYQQTKAESEDLVLKNSIRIPAVILRPSLILSPNENVNKVSKSSPFGALELSLLLIKKGIISIFPGTLQTKLDIITQSTATKLIVDLIKSPTLNHQIYHVASGDKAVTVGDILELVENKLNKRLQVKFYETEEQFKKELEKFVKFRPDLALVYKRINCFLPELAYPKIFDNSNLISQLKMVKYEDKTLKGELLSLI